MTEVVLKNGTKVLVDDKDLKLVNSIGGWHLNKDGYAITDKIINGRRKIIKMHRLLLNAQPGEEVDHRHGIRTDNRRSEIRICTHAENQHNRPKPNRNNKSGYKGVYRHQNKWIARIWSNSSSIFLGRFDDVKEAARAYNKAAIKYHGEFANLNIIKGGS